MNKDWHVFWYPVTRGKKRRVFKRVHSLPEASLFRKKIRETGYDGEVHIISRSHPYGPQNAKGPQPRGTLWCPFCVNWRSFELRDTATKEFPTPDEDVVCSVCYIPQRNYYVQKFNHLWAPVDMKKARAAAGAWGD